MAMIEADGISLRVREKALLDGISLSVAGGETVALVGANGAGKSTLLRSLSGELRPQAGTIRLKGLDLVSYGPRELAAHRAVMSQNVAISFPFTVREVVRMGAGDRGAAAVDRYVDAALAAVELRDFADRIIVTLSGGEQQRAHFARAMVQARCAEAEYGPGLLLLDEPTEGLDVRHQLELLSLLRECAAGGAAVIAVLHDLNLATLFASRIVMLQNGAVIADGSVSETITDDLLTRVFNIRTKVGAVPSGVPFLLPHAIATGRDGDASGKLR